MKRGQGSENLVNKGFARLVDNVEKSCQTRKNNKK